MAIVEKKRIHLKCNCGCGLTYFNSRQWQKHYLKDVLPRTLERWVNSGENTSLLRDVVDPRNLKIL